jgi:RNA polymerase sigma factor (sigma-70 family)
MSRQPRATNSKQPKTSVPPAAPALEGAASLPPARTQAAARALEAYRELSATIAERSKGIPTLATIIIESNPTRREAIRHALAEGVALVERERVARRAVQRFSFAPKEKENLAALIKNNSSFAEPLRKLGARLEQLHEAGVMVPKNIPIFSVSEEREVFAALAQHRMRFHTALHMIPFVREVALSELERIKEAKLQPKTVIFTQRSDTRTDAQLARHAEINASTVRGMLARSGGEISDLRNAKMATLLMEVPLPSDRLTLLMNELRSKTHGQREMRDKLVLRYGTLDKAGGQDDLEWARYATLSEELGGGCEQSEMYLRVLEQLQAPYQRLKDYIVNANTSLVRSIVGKIDRSESRRKDIIQDGVLGLMRAVEKFDVRVGFKFSTVATWWIRQSVFRNRAGYMHPIALPVHQKHSLAMVQAADAGPVRLSNEDLAKKLKLDAGLVKVFRERLKGMGSLDGNQAFSSAEWLEDTRLESSADQVARHELAERVGLMLTHLHARLGQVLRLRFGIGCEPHTLDQIARKWGITRERVRQIETKALIKARQGHLRQMVGEYLGDKDS